MDKSMMTAQKAMKKQMGMMVAPKMKKKGKKKKGMY